jgi:hypothetical protein
MGPAHRDTNLETTGGRMHATRRLALLAAATMLLAAACNDDDDGTGPNGEAEVFTATLSPAAERPDPVTTAPGAAGTATATLSASGEQIEWEVSFENLTGNPTAAHIHGPAGPEETENPIVNFAGAIPASRNGTITATTLRSVGGLLNGVSFDSLVTLLRGGNVYVNVHTTLNQPGEIRGQLGPDE